MKRTTLVSAVALIAVLGTATAGFAHGEKGQGRGDNMGKGGQHERMGGMGSRGAMMPDFATLDADGDGKVTQAEMDAYKAAKFAEIDTDGSGTVSAAEFAAQHEAASDERKAKFIATMIERMDADGDGELSADEMSGAKRKSPFERMDTDGDGTLSEDEMNAIGDRGHGKGQGQGQGKG
jgi:Ca2+-binding EF-hand superfamily protein